MELSKSLKLEQAIPAETGSGVQIAVLDTGIKKDHPDLKTAKIRTNSGPYAGNPVISHGTQTAGVLVAKDEDNILIGLAGDCTILSFKVSINDNASDNTCTIDDKAVKNVLNELKNLAAEGADPQMIINMSLDGSDNLPQDIQQVVTELVALGCIIIVAGNSTPVSLTNIADLAGVIPIGIFETEDFEDLKEDGLPESIVISFFNHPFDAPIIPSGYGPYQDSSAYTAVTSGLVARYLSQEETTKSNRFQKVKAFLKEISLPIKEEDSPKTFKSYRNA